MIPIKQTIFSDRDNGIVGNCWQACVASLLDMNLESVPHFCDYPSWPENYHKWLYAKDLVSIDFVCNNDYQLCHLGYHIISGTSPRDRSILHGVIGLNGEICFDPHPENTGLLEPEKWTYTVIFPVRK